LRRDRLRKSNNSSISSDGGGGGCGDSPESSAAAVAAAVDELQAEQPASSACQVLCLHTFQITIDDKLTAVAAATAATKSAGLCTKKRSKCAGVMAATLIGMADSESERTTSRRSWRRRDAESREGKLFREKTRANAEDSKKADRLLRSNIARARRWWVGGSSCLPSSAWPRGRNLHSKQKQRQSSQSASQQSDVLDAALRLCGQTPFAVQAARPRCPDCRSSRRPSAQDRQQRQQERRGPGPLALAARLAGFADNPIGQEAEQQQHDGGQHVEHVDGVGDSGSALLLRRRVEQIELDDWHCGL
uniref:Os08g0383700 protein n=1 Tax=Macrostomum lignano TaxID=282301 RepID=A0A1I8JR47_9PLAT